MVGKEKNKKEGSEVRSEVLSKEVALGFCVSHRGSETYGLPDVY